MPYCDLFGKDLTYGIQYSKYSRFYQLLPRRFTDFLYIQYLYERDIFLQSFDQYLLKIDSCPKNTFFFIHFLIPHQPLIFDSQGFAQIYWERTHRGEGWCTPKFRERYVEQLMFVDKKVGEILGKLKAHNLYDKSMIITSDHNYLEYDRLRIPLFIKVPFQESQHVVREKVHIVNFGKFLSSLLESNVVHIQRLQ